MVLFCMRCARVNNIEQTGTCNNLLQGKTFRRGIGEETSRGSYRCRVSNADILMLVFHQFHPQKCSNIPYLVIG